MSSNKINFCAYISFFAELYSGDKIVLSSRIWSFNCIDSHSGSNVLSDSEFSLGMGISSSCVIPTLSTSKSAVEICNNFLIPISNLRFLSLISSCAFSPSPIDIRRVCSPIIFAHAAKSFAILL